MSKIKRLLLLLPVFLIVLANRNTKLIVNVSKDTNDYQADTTYYNNDNPEITNKTDLPGNPGIVPTFSVDQNGWYRHEGRLVIAAATHECKEGKGKANCWDKLPSHASNIPLYHYGDTFSLKINGVCYPAIVMDSCGACMWADRDTKGEKFDIYVPTASSSNFVNPTGLSVEKYSDDECDGEPDVPELEPAEPPEPDPEPPEPQEESSELPATILPHAKLGTTTYDGDIEEGYIHENHKGYSMMFGKKTSKSDKEKRISDVVQLIYEHAAVEEMDINSPGDYPDNTKRGNDAYKTKVVYNKHGSFKDSIVYYNQGNYTDPNSYGGIGSIKDYGCGPTSMSIVLSSFGIDVAPVEATNWACDNGYCTASGSKHTLICGEAEAFGLSCSERNTHSSSNQQEIIDKLASGDYLAVTLAKQGHFTTGGHFFVLTGVNDDNTISVVDPGDSSKNNKTYSLDFLLNPTQGNVQKIWLISK